MNLSEKENNNIHQFSEDEIDIVELFGAIWEGKMLIILLTSVVALGSILYSLSLTNYFTSESILVSRDQQQSSPLSQLSGIASIAGIGGLTNSNSSSAEKVLEIIQSREFVKHLITFENILPSIMAPKSYDASTQALYFDPETFNAETNQWIKDPDSNQEAKPTYLQAHRKYLDMLSVSRDKVTGFISLKIEHISPVFAEEFLKLIIREANSLNRELDIENSNKALSYLKEELSQTSLLEIKKSINQLIESQLEIQMMASIHEEYSLMVLEPPFIPDVRSRPSRSIIVIFSTLIGGIFSVIFVLVRYFQSERNNLTN